MMVALSCPPAPPMPPTWEDDPRLQRITAEILLQFEAKPVGASINLLTHIEGLLQTETFPLLDVCRRLGFRPRQELDRADLRRACVMARKIMLLTPFEASRLQAGSVAERVIP